MPRLSFVVPVYKPKEDVFEKCARSLREQALQDHEVVFVLDGPSDLARKVIAKIFKKDPRVRVEEIPHAGAQAARNRGGELAQGDLLCFFDSDCAIEPGTSQMWVEEFDKRPEVGFIYSGYKFFGEKYALEAQPWDPWTLRVRNYISACVPMRRALYPGWAPELKSLQDWDMWLSLLEKASAAGWDLAGIGLYKPGYAFATAYPEEGSISGDGCKPDVWMERVRAVKKRHRLPERTVCVSSLQYPHDGLSLAKLLDADYQAIPNDKPHDYRTIIQVGFSLGQEVERHAAIFQEKHVKKILFWTGDNINEMWNGVRFGTIDSMSKLLNDCATQYCEDLEAQRLLKRLGFEAEIVPLPLGDAKIEPLPEVRKWAVDIAGDYSPMVSVIAQSLPDIDLEMVGPVTNLKEYCGLIHFFPDRTVSASVKRAILTGRHVISNIQQPHCGFVDDKWDVEKFVVKAVEKIRDLSQRDPHPEAPKLYANSAQRIMEVARA